jgi:hypothetical protein
VEADVVEGVVSRNEHLISDVQGYASLQSLLFMQIKPDG